MGFYLGIQTGETLDFMYRYSDYDEVKYRGSRFGETKAAIALFPYPFGLGQAWFKMAEAVIIGDLYILEDERLWADFWEKTAIFKNRRKRFQAAVDDFYWGKWSEGIALMGF